MISTARLCSTTPPSASAKARRQTREDSSSPCMMKSGIAFSRLSRPHGYPRAIRKSRQSAECTTRSGACRVWTIRGTLTLSAYRFPTASTRRRRCSSTCTSFCVIATVRDICPRRAPLVSQPSAICQLKSSTSSRSTRLPGHSNRRGTHTTPPSRRSFVQWSAARSLCWRVTVSSLPSLRRTLRNGSRTYCRYSRVTRAVAIRPSAASAHVTGCFGSVAHHPSPWNSVVVAYLFQASSACIRQPSSSTSSFGPTHLPVPWPLTSSAPYLRSSGWITTSAFSARSIG